MEAFNSLNSNNSNTIDILLMEVYETNNCFSQEENLTISYLDKDNNTITSFSAQNLFLKKLSIGSLDYMDIVIPKNESEEAAQYCSLDFTKWFKKRRLWVRQYKILLWVLPLSIETIKHIISFVRESGPRFVEIKIENPSTLMLMGLKQEVQYDFSEGQEYQLSEKIEMQVKKVDQFVLNEGENVEKKLEPYKSSKLSIRKVEEGQGKVYFISIINIVCSHLNSTQDEYCLVTNKFSHRFTVGTSNYADVRVKSDLTYQHCFIELVQGKWYLTAKANTNILLKLNQEKKYKVQKSTEILIGKNKVKIAIP